MITTPSLIEPRPLVAPTSLSVTVPADGARAMSDEMVRPRQTTALHPRRGLSMSSHDANPCPADKGRRNFLGLWRVPLSLMSQQVTSLASLAP